MYRILSKKIVVVVIAWLALGLYFVGKTIGDITAHDIKITTIPALTWILINGLLWNPIWRYVWKLIPTMNKLVFPDLNGEWDVELCSNWSRKLQLLEAAMDPEKAFDIRRCDKSELAPLMGVQLRAKIHQTWWGMEMTIDNPKGDTPIRHSNTISVVPFCGTELQRPGICYFYKQENSTDDVSDDNEFYGAARLTYDFEKDCLTGLAWTARMWGRAMNTAGEITFKRRTTEAKK